MTLMDSAKPTRVRRPLGLTLAIFAAFALFGFWPLLKTYLAWQFEEDRTNSDALIFSGNSTFPFDAFTQFLGLLGVLVIISAIFAWLGRPPVIRFVFQAAVLITGIALISETVYRTSDATYLDSLEQAMGGVMQGQVPVQILTALYIIWYCNRAPARAFYRQEPLQRKMEEESYEPSR